MKHVKKYLRILILTGYINVHENMYIEIYTPKLTYHLCNQKTISFKCMFAVKMIYVFQNMTDIMVNCSLINSVTNVVSFSIMD